MEASKTWLQRTIGSHRLLKAFIFLLIDMSLCYPSEPQGMPLPEGVFLILSAFPFLEALKA